MIEIFAYAFGIMYTPGPFNLLSLHAGLNGHRYSTLRFCFGGASSMLLLFLIFGYTGAWLVKPEYQLFISCVGSFYIAYLAYKIAFNKINLSTTAKANKTIQDRKLGFKAGFIMQFLNPKSFIAILPIVTVQFPATQVTGGSILIWSLILSGFAFGAPSSYLLMGTCLGRFIDNPRYFYIFNRGMALLLLYVAGDIAYTHFYLKLI